MVVTLELFYFGAKFAGELGRRQRWALGPLG